MKIGYMKILNGIVVNMKIETVGFGYTYNPSLIYINLYREM